MVVQMELQRREMGYVIWMGTTNLLELHTLNLRHRESEQKPTQHLLGLSKNSDGQIVICCIVVAIELEQGCRAIDPPDKRIDPKPTSARTVCICNGV